MKILYAASEATPFIKTGGLADVGGALPAALNKLGADVRVILPLYADIGADWRSQMKFEFYSYVKLAWRNQYCGLFSLEHRGVTFYFIDNEYYFKRKGAYGYFDDGERFGFFSKAIVELLPGLDWKPDVISANDWQTALVPVYLRQESGEFYRDIRTVFTIHNIEYQGRYEAGTLSYVFGLPDEYRSGGKMAYGDHINILKGAIYDCDALTTVSPRYAKELCDPEFASGLHEVLRQNSHKLRGILNGIDTELYDPETDPKLAANYSTADISGKAECKAELQHYFRLTEDPDVPVIACVSRLAEHKGFDLVISALDRLMENDVQFIILGTGETYLEDYFRGASFRYPGRVSANIVYSEELAMKVYSGADIFLMPSRSEPCGLSQMMAMRYGAVPVVREVGGLADTVRPYPAENSNGFSFKAYDAGDMLWVLGEAVSLFLGGKDEWAALMRRGMNCDFSWDEPSKQYMEMYEWLIS